MNAKKISLFVASLVVLVPAFPNSTEASKPLINGTINLHTSATVTDDDKNNAQSSTSTNNDALIVITHTAVADTIDNDARATSSVELSARRVSANEISSTLDLRAHAKALASSDAHINSLSLSDERISMSYKEPARLFGFIKVFVPVTATVDADGTTRVSYPWYNFLLSTDEAGLSIRAQSSVMETLAQSDNTTGTTSKMTHLSLATQARILDSLHMAFKTTAEASTSSNVQ